jgi:hypothetical protein
MTGHSSQKTPTRNRRAAGMGGRQIVLALLTGLAFLAAVFMAVILFPDSELGRTIDAHLRLLADPESWIR